MINKLRGKIYKDQGGLLPLEKDDRDVELGSFWKKEYKPKHSGKKLENFSIKDQFRNTCGWNASAGAKEIDEGVKLSARSIVIKGKQMGLISGDGFSNLRGNEKVLQKWGIAEESLLREVRSNWYNYSHAVNLNSLINDNALKHRTKSYSKINTIGDLFKAIDDGRPVKIGIGWYTGYNMTGGLRAPYILPYKKGWYVGGHAMYVLGYNANYQGKEVAIVANSLGKRYGDNGLCYIETKQLEEDMSRFGAFINHDLDVDILRWLTEHQGAVVKTEEDPDVFLIQGDKKRRYVDIPTLTAHGKSIEDIVVVKTDILDKVNQAENINFWSGDNIKQIKEVIRQNPNLKELYKDYFKDLIK